jgi:hypothetical protein
MTQIPSLDLDPFPIEFFENPHPVHEVLRRAFARPAGSSQ